MFQNGGFFVHYTNIFLFVQYIRKKAKLVKISKIGIPVQNVKVTNNRVRLFMYEEAISNSKGSTALFCSIYNLALLIFLLLQHLKKGSETKLIR